MLNKSFLVIDIGYLTLDYLVVNNLKPNYELSGATDFGTKDCLEYLKSDKDLAKPFQNPELINNAFSTGKFSIYSIEYSFPLHKEDGQVIFDGRPIIERHIKQAVDHVKNIVGMGENLDGTVVVDGGSSLIYPFVERVDSLITRCTSMV
ncbi:hypothetical protein ACFFK7_10345 [Pseudoalteromonas xiamenensis]|uniref:hypothetical protein n=1 Tax=Pseudoalteromonas xiamenensis TaxID=882626 RepID=UPI0035E5746E